jgi:hypothetical protein
MRSSKVDSEGSTKEARGKHAILGYIGKKLLQTTNLALSEEEEHLLDHRVRSSLYLREIIRFVSSSCIKTYAILHFQMF